jgi:saccharopepsin
MGDPYVKLLSLVDPNTASAEFAQQRNTSARTGIVYNAATGTSAATTIALSNSVIAAIDRFSAFLPAALALIAFNTLAVLVLLVGVGVWLCRRRSGAGNTGARQRKSKGRALTPLPLEPMATEAGGRQSTATYLGHDFSASSPAKGTYQPVSMALTEDTFVPPSPAFSRYGDGGFPKGLDRPNSVA